MARLFSDSYSSFKQRKEIKKQFKKKIFIAYEGVDTEAEYFDMIYIKNKESTNSNIEIFPVDRDKDDGKSTPYQVRNGIIEYYIEELKSNFDKKNDALWIIIDIDRHFSSEESFLEFLKSLTTNDNVLINAGITNPSFELWLILHYKKAEELDLVKVLENSKVSRKNTYVKNLVNKIKVNIANSTDIKEYFDLTKVAIENSKAPLLKTNNQDIFNSVGTSVFKLLEEIIK